MQGSWMGFKLCFDVLVKLKVNVKIKCTLEQEMVVHRWVENQL